MTTSEKVTSCSFSEHLVLLLQSTLCVTIIYAHLLVSVFLLWRKLQEVIHGLGPKLIILGHRGCGQQASVDQMHSSRHPFLPKSSWTLGLRGLYEVETFDRLTYLRCLIKRLWVVYVWCKWNNNHFRVRPGFKWHFCFFSLCGKCPRNRSLDQGSLISVPCACGESDTWRYFSHMLVGLL